MVLKLNDEILIYKLDLYNKSVGMQYTTGLLFIFNYYNPLHNHLVYYLSSRLNLYEKYPLYEKSV